MQMDLWYMPGQLEWGAEWGGLVPDVHWDPVASQ